MYLYLKKIKMRWRRDVLYRRSKKCTSLPIHVSEEDKSMDKRKMKSLTLGVGEKNKAFEKLTPQRPLRESPGKLPIPELL